MTKVDQTCHSCNQPVSDAFLCRSCVAKTRRHLANQAAYLGDLEVELARMSRKTAESDGGKASLPASWAQAGDAYLDEITPANLREWDRRARAAGALIAEQRNLLVSWTKLCCEERLLAEWPADTVPAMSCALIVALPHLRKHEAAGELVAEFRALDERIVKVIDSPENRTRVLVGPCCMEYTDEYDVMEFCPGEVEALVPADERVRPVLRCSECKSQWFAEQWFSVGRRIENRKEQLLTQAALVRSFSRRKAS